MSHYERVFFGEIIDAMPPDVRQRFYRMDAEDRAWTLWARWSSAEKEQADAAGGMTTRGSQAPGSAGETRAADREHAGMRAVPGPIPDDGSPVATVIAAGQAQPGRPIPNRARRRMEKQRRRKLHRSK